MKQLVIGDLGPIARKLNNLCPKKHLNRLVWALKAHTEWSVRNPNDFVLFVLIPIRLTDIQTFKNVRNPNKIVRILDVVRLLNHTEVNCARTKLGQFSDVDCSCLNTEMINTKKCLCFKNNLKFL